MSIFNNIWKVAKDVPDSFIKEFPEYDSLTLQLLYNRNIKNQREIDEFFNPDYSQDLFDPFLLKNMDRALQRIKIAKDKNERVAIFGDYDADGVTSTVLLMELFRDILGLKGQVYIPDRKTEGYGMNISAIDWLKGKKIDLIITCDCGVSNKKEIDYAAKNGIDVIVTDHHSLPHSFSDEYIIIDPKQDGDKYPYKELAGVGIVFKLAQAVIGQKDEFKISKLQAGTEKMFLDLVAIGTVADCSPILSENRTLVKYGLEILKLGPRPGLRALLEIAGIDRSSISTYSIGFAIAPRINAAGRLDHANDAYKLISTKDKEEANKLAEKLQLSNTKRQELTSEIVGKAKIIIEKGKPLDKLIAVAGSDWPIGVVGIVAGRLTEEYGRPVLVAGINEEETVGSARSIEEYNIINAIRKYKKILVEYGGHRQAAGFTVANDNMNKFFDQMRKDANRALDNNDLVKRIIIDKILKLDQINWDLIKMLEKFEPYGIDNDQPLFQINDILVNKIKHVGRDKRHLKISVKGVDFEIMGFNMGNYINKLKLQDSINIIAKIGVNEWNGQKKIQLVLVDLLIS